MGGILSIGERGSKAESSFQGFCAVRPMTCGGGRGEAEFPRVSIRSGHREPECPLEFAVVETFISDSEEGDSFRTYKALSSCLPSSVHDLFFVFRENGGQREVERLGGSEDKVARILWALDVFELRRFSVTRFKVGKDKGSKGRRNEEGEVCGGYHCVVVTVDLIPNGKLIAGEVIKGTATSPRGDRSATSIVEVSMPEPGGQDSGW